jgi:hypothetical protein
VVHAPLDCRALQAAPGLRGCDLLTLPVDYLADLDLSTSADLGVSLDLSVVACGELEWLGSNGRSHAHRTSSSSIQWTGSP